MNVSGTDPLPPQPHTRNTSQSEHAKAFKDEIAEYGDSVKEESPRAAAAIDRVVTSTQAGIDDTNRKTRNDETRAVNRFLEQTESGKQNIQLAVDGGDHHSINERAIDKIRNTSHTATTTTSSSLPPAINDIHSGDADMISQQQTDMANDMKVKAKELKNDAGEKAAELKTKASDTANKVSAKMESAKETTVDKLNQAKQSVDAYAQQAKENTSAALSHAQQTAEDTAAALKRRTAETTETIKQTANELSEAAKVRYEQTKHELASGAQQLSDGLRQRYDSAKAYVSDTAASAENRMHQTAAAAQTKLDTHVPSHVSSEKSEDGSFKDISYETTPLPMSVDAPSTTTTRTNYVSEKFGPQHGSTAASFAAHAMGAAETAHAEPVGFGSDPGVNTGSLPPVDPMFDAGAKLGYATEQMSEM